MTLCQLDHEQRRVALGATSSFVAEISVTTRAISALPTTLRVEDHHAVAVRAGERRAFQQDSARQALIAQEVTLSAALPRHRRALYVSASAND